MMFDANDELCHNNGSSAQHVQRITSTKRKVCTLIDMSASQHVMGVPMRIDTLIAILI